MCLGVEHGNLRELAAVRMAELDLQCRDIRSREVGIRQIHQKSSPDQVSDCLISEWFQLNFNPDRWNSSVEITLPMGAGKRFLLMRIQ